MTAASLTDVLTITGTDGINIDAAGNLSLDLANNGGLTIINKQLAINGLASTACTAPEKALSWNGSAFSCVNGTSWLLEAGGVSGTQAIAHNNIVTFNAANTNFPGLSVSRTNGTIAYNLNLSLGNGLQFSGNTISLKLLNGSGLSVDGNGLSLDRSCKNGQIMKWNSASSNWTCAWDDDTLAQPEFWIQCHISPGPNYTLAAGNASYSTGAFVYYFFDLIPRDGNRNPDAGEELATITPAEGADPAACSPKTDFRNATYCPADGGMASANAVDLYARRGWFALCNYYRSSADPVVDRTILRASSDVRYGDIRIQGMFLRYSAQFR